MSWAHEPLAVAWPQSPLEPKGWGLGVEDTAVPASLSQALVGCCLAAAALVRGLGRPRLRNQRARSREGRTPTPEARALGRGRRPMAGRGGSSTGR